MRKWMAIALIGMVSLSACSGDPDDPADGTGSGTAVEASPGSESTGEDSAGEDSAGAPAESAPAETADIAFGETFAYPDGLTVAVSAPEVFMPSATSVNGGEPDFVTFTVTLVNGTGAEVVPGEVFVTVLSGSGEGGEVLDPDAGISGPPADAVAPGGESSWPMAFGVLDGSDVLVRVQPGMNLDPVSFGG